MQTNDYKKILEDINRQIFYPVYILMGNENYFIDKLSKELQNNILTEDQRAFDETILYGNDTNVNQINSIAKRFPTIAKKHLIIVREAQNVKNIEKLESLLEKNIDHISLIISYKGKTIDKRKKFIKLAIEKGVVFESKKLYDNQIPTWVNGYLKQKGYSIEPRAISLLLESLGSNLEKINNSLKKVLSIIDHKNITSKDIADNIGISNEYNIFELTKAIGIKNISKSFKIINKFSEDTKNHPSVVTIAMLYRYFQQLLIYLTEKNKTPQNIASKLGINPFFVKDYQIASTNYDIRKCVYIIEYISNADKKLKGYNSPSIRDKDIMVELLFKIFN